MNGIIHPCSHPNDDDPHFRITEEQIFSNIFHYIEVLFRTIKPQKVFFMAVDGVAPRAKMNQQRSRRFRSAREAEDNIKKALKKGETLPSEERFDSNCITPGTEFMVRLNEQLNYFVNKKISTDPGWQGVMIYLSGHETPGEGEHKIMDFIRYERSQPGYDPNTRHCLYGLDADLIMLGLTSHDPHFSLLREEVRFGKSVKRISNPEDITFHLLHLSLMREYIDWEFESLKDKISFGYDLEKIIDDWILMGFLVGNDFVPNLPNFHINHDALPYLWQVYKDIMPSLDGYLHDGGSLNLQRFETYITTLSKFDFEKFEDSYLDLKWLESKKAQSNEQESSEASESDVDGALFSGLADMSLEPEKEDKKDKTEGKSTGRLVEYLQEKGVLDDDEDDGDFTEEHEKYKLRYYKEKFKIDEDNDESCKEIAKQLCFKYVEAIQWILHYYFNGVPSWGWFYPFHYAPYVSDIKDFQDHPLSFDMGTPFLPFEQLLAVLPAASKKLLPEPFQSLMFMEHSPIIDYYPLEFETDLNGKRQDWEAVVLIPFIDEKRLLEAMKPLYPRLKKSEKDRNRHSPCLLYTHDPAKCDRYPSSLPGIFPDLECCRASCKTVPIDKYRLSRDQIVKGLLPDVKLDVYFPGFPTLKHIAHSGELRKVGVKVFQMHSRGESMVLTIDETDELDSKEIADSLLGRPCYVGWPHLVEAFVTSVSDGSKKYLIAKDSPDNIKEVTFNDSDTSVWKKTVSCEKQEYIEKKAVDIGMTHILIEACQIQGKKYVCGPNGSVHLEKIWSDWAVTFPLQVTVKNINVCDETDAGAQYETVSDLFPVETECFMMAIPHYGSSGKVIEVDAKTSRVRVQLTVAPEPDLVSLIVNKDDFAEAYMPAHIMAKRLGLTSNALGKITGKVFLTKDDKENSAKIDIGLNLKFSKQDKEVLGYARRDGGNWNYSPKAMKTISTYQEKFPQVFDALSSNSAEVLKVSDVFPDNEKNERLAAVEKWLKSLPSHKQKAVKCGSSILDEPIVKQIEETVLKLKEEKQNRKSVKVRVKPTVLYRPMKQHGQVLPDPSAKFELFDRVVNVRTLGVAPYGLKGTIVGIHSGADENEPVRYEVLFDEPFMGGQSLRGSDSFENKLYVMQEWSLLNLSHGQRLECKKKGIPSPLEKHKNRQYSSGQHNKAGVPAEYKPSNRGGKFHRDFYSAWHSSQTSTDPQSPNGRSPNTHERSPNTHERFSSPRPRFSSPEFNSSGQRHRFPPRWSSPRNQQGYSPLNFQGSPRDSSRFYTPPAHRSPASTKEINNKEQLSAQESERVIRELLHLDAESSSNPNANSPHTATVADYSFPMPPMSPTSPISPSISSDPSGMLVLVCYHNRWPLPSFSHHRIAQHFITTVCVAGKLYQGCPCATIEESTERAAEAALMTISPNSFPLALASPFFFSLSPPNVQPSPQHKNTSGQRHHPEGQETPKREDRIPRKQDVDPMKIEGTPKSSQDKKSSKGLSTSFISQNLFVPLQVSLKQKKTSPQSSKDIESQESIEPEDSTTENLKLNKIEQAKTSTATKSKNSEGETRTKDNGSESLENEMTMNATAAKAKPKLLAPSFFTKIE